MSRKPGRKRPGAYSIPYAVAALILACDADDPNGIGPGVSTVTVEFVYLASTTIDPAVQNAFPSCVSGVGVTHIHPSWRGFARVNMRAATSDRWEIGFDDVSVGDSLRIRISDPNVCANNPTGAATQNVSANGAALTDIVDTPGSGIEPGLGFSVAADGTVTP